MRYDPELFQVDGALRDICVLDADAGLWQRVLDALPAAGWPLSFHTDLRDGDPGPSDVPTAEIFADAHRPEGGSTELYVTVGALNLQCFFFDADEIEFSFDPADVASEEEFASLSTFMTWLARVTGRRVLLTMETSDHRTIPPLLTVG